MIDFEKLSKAYDGSVGLLMMIDHFSKFVVATPVESFTAEEAARALWYHWVPLCGIPDVIHSVGAETNSAPEAVEEETIEQPRYNLRARNTTTRPEYHYCRTTAIHS